MRYKVGEIQALLIDLHLADDSWGVLDSHTSELEALHSHMFTQHAGILRPQLVEIYGEDMLCDPILYVERVLVAVAHRGRELGLRAFDALLDHHRGVASLAFCKPFPMFRTAEHLSKKEMKYFDPARAQVSLDGAKRHLAAYWRRLGFRKLGRGPYYVVDVRQRESLDERLGEAW